MPPSAFMGYYGPSWGHLGAILGPSWSYLGAILCHLGALLGLSWAILGPPWGHLWGYLGSSQGPLEGLFGPPGAIMGHCVVVLGLISDHGGCKFNYNARNVLPLHIQSTSICYSPLAFRFIARQVLLLSLVFPMKGPPGYFSNVRYTIGVY